jgi:thiol peroxidase
MNQLIRLSSAIAILFILAAGCATKASRIAVNSESVAPGGIVQKGAQQFHLLGTPLQVGMPLPDTVLVDAFTMEEVSLAQTRGRVAIISVVPSIDTKVCEAQTHYLGEQGDRLPEGIERITISRDTPFAQKRFAEEAKLTDVQFLSDYRDGAFGMATGLLIERIKLLARSVIVADKAGIVRYIQVVPQLGELPDLDRAFDIASRLAEQP